MFKCLSSSPWQLNSNWNLRHDMNFFFSFMSPENRSSTSVFSPSQLTITQSSSKNQQSLGHKQCQLHNQKKNYFPFNLSARKMWLQQLQGHPAWSILTACSCVRKMSSALSNYRLTLSGEQSLFLQFSWLVEMEVFFVLFFTCTTKPTCSAIIVLFYYSS